MLFSNIEDEGTSSKENYGFDWFNQNSFSAADVGASKVKTTHKFLLNFTFLSSDYPEGSLCCGFSGAWNSKFPCRMCLIGRDKLSRTDTKPPLRNFDYLRKLWEEGESPAGSKDHTSGYRKGFREAPGLSGWAATNQTEFSTEEFVKIRHLLRLGLTPQR